MRICGTCKLEKSLEEFHKKKKGWNYKCKSCSKIYHRQHYLANSRVYKSQARSWMKMRKLKFLEFLKTKECVDCGNSDVRVFEFDHIVDNKTYNVAYLLNSASNTRLYAEIAKCEIVCANCHRIRTAERGKRGTWYKSLAR